MEIKFYDIIMYGKFSDLFKWEVRDLPVGFEYKLYESYDDAVAWQRMWTDNGNFPSTEKAKEYFDRTFLPFEHELKRRMGFIINDKKEIVSTCSAWFKYNEKNEYMSIMHWLCTDDKYQGLGLAKAMFIYAINLYKDMPKTKYNFLHTQTTSYKAIELYGKLGYSIYYKPYFKYQTDVLGLDIIKELIDKKIYERII
ncbi:MAG: GNAT family N-acetyltransferase [Erysipelotrichaceae bacterium]